MAQRLIGGYVRARIVLTGVAAAAAALAAGAAAAPTAFELRFDGVHTPATIQSNSGLQHEGPFTAGEPFCSSGYAVDVRFEGPVAVRRHTCSDGSGSFTARIDPAMAEHEGQGDWQIVEGTGRYEKLRGKGTFRGVFVAGDPGDGDPASIGFRTTWTGLVDFDDVAPEVAISTAAVRRLPRPRATYLVRLVFSARDDSGAVAYRVGVTAPRQAFPLAARAGTTAGERVSLPIRLKPRGARILKIEIVARDPLGNERTVVRSVRVPS